jgi:hypothetical protein
MEIVRDDKKVFQTKQMSKDDFVRDMLESELHGGNGVCDKGSYVVVKALSQHDMDMSRMDGNMVLTRYFSYKKGKITEWYAVFEKVVNE